MYDEDADTRKETSALSITSLFWAGHTTVLSHLGCFTSCLHSLYRIASVYLVSCIVLSRLALSGPHVLTCLSTSCRAKSLSRVVLTHLFSPCLALSSPAVPYFILSSLSCLAVPCLSATFLTLSRVTLPCLHLVCIVLVCLAVFFIGVRSYFRCCALPSLVLRCSV